MAATSTDDLESVASERFGCCEQRASLMAEGDVRRAVEVAAGAGAAAVRAR